MVPMTKRADSGEEGQDQREAEGSEDGVRREELTHEGHLSVGGAEADAATTGMPGALVSTRHTGRGQEQAAGVGGFPAPGLNPAGPSHLSTDFCHSPELMYFFSASVTCVQNAVSPFFRPTP